MVDKILNNEQHLIQYQGTITKVAKSKFVNSGFTVEDIEQELKMHLFKKYDKIRKDKDHYYHDIPLDERVRFIKTILANKLRDIIRQQAVRFDTSDYNRNELVDEHFDGVFKRSICARDSKEYCEYNKMRRKIIRWARKQEPGVRFTIESIVNPNRNLKKVWSRMKKDNSRLRNKDSIPPFTACRIANVKQGAWYTAMHYLKKHLKSHGFLVH